MKNKDLLIGHVIAGSLVDGLVIRIDSHVTLESIKTGKFVSIIGSEYRFFSLITNLTLAFSHPDIALLPPEPNEILFSFLKEKDMYATAEIKPLIMADKNQKILPVKTIPSHFCPVYEANESDVALIFGSESDASKKYFEIGSPLDMNTPICIDLEKLTERSNGIFGKTGTGKTFITRLILAGLIKHEKASLIIFDMHSEYGLQARKEGGSHVFVKGLKTLFSEKIALFSLDPESTRRRGMSADVEFVLSYDEIHVEDILSLGDELNLHATAFEAAYLIAAHYKKEWLSVLLSNGHNIKEFALSLGAHPESVAALYRKLKRIESLPFLTAQSHSHSVINQMMEYIDRGISIIIEFGNFTQTFVYLLIANIITRRIHTHYIAKTERFLGNPHKNQEPHKLMICIEEAHKFLNPQAARQTIFGTIAREMRKYYVSLLIVDQRPSEIDQEILSQIGTKIIAQLHDEKDINAVLSGVNNATSLRSILASLDSKQQALVIGHAITMPVVIQTRAYDELFYQQIASHVAYKTVENLIDELY
jgi:DNA helicase HerA-like ATPase